jgi:trehalose 6-phosphate phosphatase
LTAALHYRGVSDESAARAQLEQIAASAREAGFVARFGRKVLEIVPPLRADKGTAIRALLDRHGLRRALAAGDDTTDLDAFRALDGLEVAVRVAVASDEGPVELKEAADVVVGSTAGFLPLLRQL